MDIDINTTLAKSANEQLPLIINHISETKESVSRIMSLIDPRVLERANLRSMFRNVLNGIESVESDLMLLHRTVMQNIIAYEEAEARVRTKVQNVPSAIE
ncbi:MAG: hypothetical protein FWF80_07945 [Defluviitaleaceae bacterium]|nr:hypothetical protein [Defluviitaleaceae bacterium]